MEFLNLGAPPKYDANQVLADRIKFLDTLQLDHELAAKALKLINMDYERDEHLNLPLGPRQDVVATVCQINAMETDSIETLQQKVALIHGLLSILAQSKIDKVSIDTWYHVVDNLQLPISSVLAASMISRNDMIVFQMGLEFVEKSKGDNKTENLRIFLTALFDIVQNWKNPPASKMMETWLKCCKIILLQSKSLETNLKADLIDLPIDEIDTSEVYGWFEDALARVYGIVDAIDQTSKLSSSVGNVDNYSNVNVGALSDFVSILTGKGGAKVNVDNILPLLNDNDIKSGIVHAVKFLTLFDLKTMKGRNGLDLEQVMNLTNT